MEPSDATEKTPATPGIDPGTFHLVAQCLNHYTTPGPEYQCYSHIMFINIIHIKILISKTYIKGSYHIYYGRVGEETCRHATVSVQGK
jgi:hypothetical protein